MWELSIYSQEQEQMRATGRLDSVLAAYIVTTCPSQSQKLSHQVKDSGSHKDRSQCGGCILNWSFELFFFLL